jgi:hypothetical protein
MDILRRFTRPLTLDALEDVLGGVKLPTEPVPGAIALEPVRQAVADAVAGLDAEDRSTMLDRSLVGPLHRALAGLSPRQAADMRVWHWLCSVEFPGLVWQRWGQGSGVPEPGELSRMLTHAMGGRFTGAASLNGVSRNTLARLWWTAQTLGAQEDYDLARRALSNQDMFQNIFERFFGISPVVARACVRRLDGESPGDIRRATRWLQHCASTAVLESLDEDGVTGILDEALVMAAA